MFNFIKKTWEYGWKIYHKYEEIWNYLITGALGVLVNIIAYSLCRLINLNIVASNVISWIISVLFMYLTNKIFVFKSKKNNLFELIKEFISFVLARVFTLVVETGILFFGSNILKINDIIVKIIAQIIIIILNYILSKMLVFKKNKNN